MPSLAAWRHVLLIAMIVGAGACRSAPAHLPAVTPPAPRVDPTVTQTIAPSKSARIGENIDARIGETFTIAGESLSVTLEQVVEDSRCPANVTCIWAGRAIVRARLRSANKESAERDIPTDTDEGVTFDKYRLRLVQLMPTPMGSTSIPPDQYIATFVVSK